MKEENVNLRKERAAMAANLGSMRWLASVRTATRSLACLLLEWVKNAYEVPF